MNALLFDKPDRSEGIASASEDLGIPEGLSVSPESVSAESVPAESVSPESVPTEHGDERPLVAGLPSEIHLLRWLAQHGVEQALIASGAPMVPGLDAVGDEAPLADGGSGIEGAPVLGHCEEIRRLVASGEAGELPGFRGVDCVDPVCGMASLALSIRDRLVAEEGAGQPFLFVDAGRLYGFDLSALIRSHATSPAIATLAVRRVGRHEVRPESSLRVEMDRSGRILRLARAAVDPTLEFECVGVGVVETDLLRHVDADRVDVSFEEVFQFVLRKQGVLVGEEVHGPVLELGTPEAVRRAELVLASV